MDEKVAERRALVLKLGEENRPIASGIVQEAISTIESLQLEVRELEEDDKAGLSVFKQQTKIITQLQAQLKEREKLLDRVFGDICCMDGAVKKGTARALMTYDRRNRPAREDIAKRNAAAISSTLFSSTSTSGEGEG